MSLEFRKRQTLTSTGSSGVSARGMSDISAPPASTTPGERIVCLDGLVSRMGVRTRRNLRTEGALMACIAPDKARKMVR